MKSILFATTALVASAGVASADIALSGSAQAGVGSQDGADAVIYSAATLTATMTGTTDAGLTFGASVDVTEGREFDVEDIENDGFANFVDFDDEESSDGLGLGNVFVEFGGSKLTFDVNGIDDVYNDDYEDHDVKFEYALNGFSTELTVDGEPGAGNSEFSYLLAYTFSGITATVKGSDLDEALSAKLAYATDVFSVGVEFDQAEAGDSVTTVDGSYTFNGITLSAEAADDDTYEVGVAYAMNGISLGVTYDDEEVFDLNGSYDLGGGLMLVGGYETEGTTAAGGDSYVFGVGMTF